ncbi:MAG: branched-chain amino acid ABC transporter permease [Marinosulfonomonas sp.]|nr:branched-chain amino acid ABC transporter permease [Marinosulfonomonas sp.]
MITYVVTVFSLMLITALLCISFDILAGDLKLMSLATPAIAGVGAYAAAICDVTYGLPLSLGLLAAIGASCTIGFVLAAISVRVSDVYFLLVSMAMGLILVTIFDQARSITNGPSGIAGVAPFEVFGLTVPQSGLLIGISLLVVVGLVVTAIRRSYIGRRWRALGDDKLAATNVGIDPKRELVKCVVLSSGVAGTAGFLHAHVVGIVDPSPFGLQAAILILALAIVGGSGRVWGSIAGASVGIFIPEVLRFVPLENLAAHQSVIREVIFGVLLVFFLGFRPNGLLGRKTVTQMSVS